MSGWKWMNANCSHNSLLSFNLPILWPSFCLLFLLVLVITQILKTIHIILVPLLIPRVDRVSVGLASASFFDMPIDVVIVERKVNEWNHAIHIGHWGVPLVIRSPLKVFVEEAHREERSNTVNWNYGAKNAQSLNSVAFQPFVAWSEHNEAQPCEKTNSS